MHLPSHRYWEARIRAALTIADGAIRSAARHIGRRGLVGLLMLAGVSGLAGLGAETSPKELGEYELKAEFLHKFVNLVDWPGTAFTNANAPIIIGVLGEDPFKQDLERVFGKKKPLNGHPFVLQRFAASEPVPGCHLLFIGDVGPKALADALLRLRGTGVLTVGESPRFCEQGGMIQFLEEKSDVGKVFLRWEINYGAVEEAHLKVGMPLLKLAKKVWRAPVKEGPLK